MTKRLTIWIALVLALCAAPGFGQNVAAGTYASTLTATASSCTATGTVCLIVPLNSTVGSVAFQLSGTFSATMTFEGTVDGTNWVTVYAVPPGAFVGTSSGPAVSTATAAGVFRMNVGGFASVRARCSAFTSGSVAITAKRAANVIPFSVAQ